MAQSFNKDRILNNKLTTISIFIFFLFSCDSNNEDKNSKYSGIWIEEISENIIEILDDGEVIFYDCNFSGYQPIEELDYDIHIEEDEFILTSHSEVITSVLSIDENVLTFTQNEVEVSSMEKLDSIPDLCFGSAIQISYISTTEIIDGQAATFTIDFDYRLTEPVAEIEVYFSSVDGNLDAPRQVALEVFESSSGNASVTIDYTPVKITDDEPYYVYLYMLKADIESGPSIALGTDKKILTFLN
jgi:hypothetical protein